jgi:acetyl esterase
MHAPITTSLAMHTGFIVVGIEYRRAPEHKCPAAHEDCLAAVKWISEHAAALVSEGVSE